MTCQDVYCLILTSFLEGSLEKVGYAVKKKRQHDPLSCSKDEHCSGLLAQ